MGLGASIHRMSAKGGAIYGGLFEAVKKTAFPAPEGNPRGCGPEGLSLHQGLIRAEESRHS